MKKLLLLTLFAVALFSCDKDDDFFNKNRIISSIRIDNGNNTRQIEFNYDFSNMITEMRLIENGSMTSLLRASYGNSTIYYSTTDYPGGFVYMESVAKLNSRGLIYSIENKYREPDGDYIEENSFKYDFNNQLYKSNCFGNKYDIVWNAGNIEAISYFDGYYVTEEAYYGTIPNNANLDLSCIVCSLLEGYGSFTGDASLFYAFQGFYGYSSINMPIELKGKTSRYFINYKFDRYDFITDIEVISNGRVISRYHIFYR